MSASQIGALCGVDELACRQRAVLSLIARGVSHTEVAVSPLVTRATSKTRVNQLSRTLGLRDCVQVVVLACESGFLTPGAHRDVVR